VICRLVLFLALGAAVLLRAQPAPASQPDIESDVQSLDTATGIAVLKGKVRMKDEGVLLTAEEVRYKTTANYVE